MKKKESRTQSKKVETFKPANICAKSLTLMKHTRENNR